jgi:hypothetical protein
MLLSCHEAMHCNHIAQKINFINFYEGDNIMIKKDYMENTKKLAKITRIICRISIIASLVGVVLLAITTIVAYVVSPEHIKPLTDSGKLNIFLTGNLYVPANIFTSVEALRGYLMEMLARVTVGVGIFISVAIHVMGLLKTVENSTPFEIQNVTRLRKISIAIIIGSVLMPSVTSFAAIHSASQSLLDVKTNSMIDVTLLLCGFLVLILSGIFAYGARLQREHDQTV